MFGALYAICGFAIMLAPLIIIVVIVILIARAAGSPPKQKTDASLEEIHRIDYAIRFLNTVLVDKTINRKNYDTLRERLLARRDQVISMEAVEHREAARTTQPAKAEAAEESVVKLATVQPVQTVKSKPKEPLTMAVIIRWLLYLGVFLLFVATVIFALYKWETFPEIVKFSILLVVTGLFYLGGYLLESRLRLRVGGTAVIAVGAIMTFFDAAILLNAKDLADNLLAWSIALAAVAFVYQAMAGILKHGFLTYLSAVSAGCAVSAYFLYCQDNMPESDFIGRYACIYAWAAGLTFLAAVGSWVSSAVSEESPLRRYIGRPLWISSNIASALGYPMVALVTLIILVETQAGVQTMLAAGAYCAILITYSLLTYQMGKDVIFLTPIFLTPVILVSCSLVYFKTPVDYWALAGFFTALSAILTKITLTHRQVRHAFITQLEWFGYIVACLVGFLYTFYLIDTLLEKGIVATGTWQIIATLAAAAGVSLAALYVRRNPQVAAFVIASLSALVLAVMFKTGIPARYSPTVVTIVALMWTVFAQLIKKRDWAKLFIPPIQVIAPVMAIAGGLAVIISVIDNESWILAASPANLAGLAAQAIVYACMSIFFVWPGTVHGGLAFAIAFSVFSSIRAGLPAEYVPAVIAVWPILLIGLEWLKRVSGSKKIWDALNQAGLIFGVVAGAITLANVVALTLMYSIGSAADWPAVSAAGLVAVFFAWRSAVKQQETAAFATILFTSVFLALLAIKSGLPAEYLPVMAAILAFSCLLPGSITRRLNVPYWEVPLRFWGYVFSAAAVAGGYQQADSVFLSALLISGSGFIGSALFMKKYGAHLWAGLLMISAAVLHGAGVYAPLAWPRNIVYIGFYLAAFSISLTFRQFGGERPVEWAKHLAVFALGFAAFQLIIQSIDYLVFSAPDTIGINIGSASTVLAFAFIVAGFFYVSSAQFYAWEILPYAGYGFFLSGYLVKASGLELTYIEWYAVPISVYALLMGFLLSRAHPDWKIRPPANIVGLLLCLAPSTIAFMATPDQPSASIHALLAAGFALAFILLGVVGRTFVFMAGGAVFLAWNAIYQSWEFVYALPKWITIGSLGLVFVIAGILLERNREAFLNVLKKTQAAIVKEWQ